MSNKWFRKPLCCIDFGVVNVSELKDVYEIELLSFGKEAYPFNLFLFYYLIAGELFIVARCINKPVGYVIAVIEERYGRKLGHIISIAVHPLYRGMGIGKDLMRIIEKILVDNKVDLIYLEVRKSNKIAIEMYSKLGYKIAKELPKYYGDEDGYLMMKTNVDNIYSRQNR
ncbi:MAG: ribosomal-protein-alanine N-acetyltransferase [Thermoprotei archaeon]|nr:MAG: ribosomal-protein-alanine N-acetyltransferase [Thermoprotei archaeon]